MEIKITPCEINLLKENNLSAFSPSAKFCDHPICLDTRHPFHPGRKPCARQYPLSSPLTPPLPSAATQLLHPRGLTCLDPAPDGITPMGPCVWLLSLSIRFARVICAVTWLVLASFSQLYNTPLCEQTTGF